MKYITLVQAQQAVRWAVTERGENYINHGVCKYVMNEEPSCLVGTALHHLGVPISVLLKMDVCDGGSAFALGGIVMDLLKREGYEFQPDAITFLSRAQSAQDAHETWGNAERRGLESLT